MTTLADRLALVDTLEPQRIHSVARLSHLLTAGSLAQVAPAAFILPLGLQGFAADEVTGLYRQPILRVAGVLLVVRSAGDAAGEKAGAEMDALIEGVIAVVCGWGPGNAIDGTYRLSKGELQSIAAGTIQYQLEFILDDQLRITT